MRILTTREQGFPWHHRAGLHAKGYVFDETESFRRGDGLLDYFGTAKDADGFRDLVRAANGSFAVILETGSQVFAAVDRVRGIPLFYGVCGEDLILGDDVDAIQNMLGGVMIDAIAREEFLRVGYTVGSGTLDPRIRQIEAGDCFIFDKTTFKKSTHAYFRHVHGNYTDKSEEVLIEELDQITSRWTRRLITSAGGRTLVVPLSGGYDSRSIVCALKREGYPNVVCYSYGAVACYEHQTATRVAEQLDYPIHVIEYDRERWRSTIESPHFPDFCRFLFQRSAIPCIQEYPARQAMSEAGQLPADAIIVPGYCGDLQGGSHVPAEVLEHRSRVILAEGVENYICRTLFDLLSIPMTPVARQAITDRIRAYTSQFASSDIESFCSVNEDWFIRHRVAKFVVNTVRTHEWFGNEWRLPLWDNELIEWWNRIPLRHRLGSALYHRFLFERLFNPMGVAFRKPKVRTRLDRIAQRYLPGALIPMVQALYTRTLGRLRPRAVDVGAFDDASLVLLRQCGTGQSLADFANINGVIAAWCDAILAGMRSSQTL